MSDIEKKNHRSHRYWPAAAAGIALAALAFSSNSQASEEYEVYPADLVSGYCGHDSIVARIKDYDINVPCANVDTHTGEAWTEKEVCYVPEHKGWGHYKKHCVIHKIHMQLPILKVKKMAYDYHHNLIKNAYSDEFPMRVLSNRTGYEKHFKLKSEGKWSYIVSSGKYNVAEHVYGYDAHINCGDQGESYGYAHDVHVGVGKTVVCTVNNKQHKPYHYYKPVYKPVHKPKPAHKPKPVYKPRPAHKPKAPYIPGCWAKGDSLSSAKRAYEHACHVRRKDCDPVGGSWYCSSEKIGKYAPRD